MDKYSLIVDTPAPDMLRLTLTDSAGQVVVSQDVPYRGHVDNILLTAVDNLLKTNSIDRSALVTVAAGSGIDKNSSLYRIVTSFASAVAAAHAVGR